MIKCYKDPDVIYYFLEHGILIQKINYMSGGKVVKNKNKNKNKSNVITKL